jgi:hypothetical protein
MLLMRVVVEEWGVCTAATQVGQKEQNEWQACMHTVSSSSWNKMRWDRDDDRTRRVDTFFSFCIFPTREKRNLLLLPPPNKIRIRKALDELFLHKIIDYIHCLEFFFFTVDANDN